MGDINQSTVLYCAIVKTAVVLKFKSEGVVSCLLKNYK